MLGHFIPILLQMIGEISAVYDEVETVTIDASGHQVTTIQKINKMIRFNGIKKAVILLLSLPSYLFFAPTYIHIFLINAFSRIDDLSWGTKGNSSLPEK